MKIGNSLCSVKGLTVGNTWLDIDSYIIICGSVHLGVNGHYNIWNMC